MKTRRDSTVLFLWMFVLATLPAAAGEIHVRDLGQGPGSGAAFGISNTGYVVGTWNGRPSRWNPDGTRVDLGDAPGHAFAVNDAGEAVGTHTDVSGSHSFFSAADGSTIDLLVPGTSLNDLDATGMAVGCYSRVSHGTLATVPIIWSAGRPVQELDTLGFRNGCALGINDSSEIVGYVGGAAGSHAVRWSIDGVATDLGTLYRSAVAEAINAGGDVVGQSDALVGSSSRVLAFYANPDGPLQPLPGFEPFVISRALDISDDGYVAGFGYLETGGPQFDVVPLLWTPDHALRELPSLASTSRFAIAYGVNRRGQAVGVDEVFDAVSGRPFARPVLWTFARTPAQILADLIERVRQLGSNGTLNGGQVNALLVKLQAALADILASDPAAAIARLETFVSQVEAFLNAGVLPPDVGSELLELAGQAIELLRG